MPSAHGTRRAILIVAVAFTAGMSTAISIVDARGGGMLARYFEEYAGGGSCKWRGTNGESFQALLVVGLLAWPAGVGAAAIALTEMIVEVRTRALRGRAILVFTGTIVVVLLALLQLASLRAVAGARGDCWARLAPGTRDAARHGR